MSQLGLTLHRDRLDLSATDVEAALGSVLAFKPQTQFCSIGISEQEDIAVIFDQYLAVRGFVIENDHFRTPEGLALGSTTEDISTAFGADYIAELYNGESRAGGSVVVVADQEHLNAEPGPGTLHYAFDTDGNGTVRRLRAGFWPYVSYPDLCSRSAAEDHYAGWPLEDR